VRGNLVKHLGEIGGFTGKGGADLLDFAVDNIQADPTCPLPSQPTKGHFLVASMRVTVSPTAPQDLTGVLNPYDFSLVNPDGVTETSIASFECLNASDRLPNSYSPGSQYVGKLVFDVAATHGILVYRPTGSTWGGWEWNF
jgi:hypothetical protein